jgi:hypothetical protein
LAAYATPTDMINCFNAEILGDVVSDNGVAVAVNALETDPKLLSALQRASGEVEAACLAGGIYTTAQLAGLTDNGQALLVDIVCCVAMCKLLQRRPTKGTADMLTGVCKDARDQLQALRKGEAVFGGSTNADNGTLPETTGPTTVTFTNLRMLRDRVQNYYPRRNLPNGR